MWSGVFAFLMCWGIGKVDPHGVRDRLGIVIAGAVLFGCGAIVIALRQDKD